MLKGTVENMYGHNLFSFIHMVQQLKSNTVLMSYSFSNETDNLCVSSLFE